MKSSCLILNLESNDVIFSIRCSTKCIKMRRTSRSPPLNVKTQNGGEKSFGYLLALRIKTNKERKKNPETKHWNAAQTGSFNRPTLELVTSRKTTLRFQPIVCLYRPCC